MRICNLWRRKGSLAMFAYYFRYYMMYVYALRSVAVQHIDEAETRRFCWHLADTIGAYRTSTVLDLIAGSAIELEYIFGKPLDIAMSLSVNSSSAVPSREELGDGDNVRRISCWPRRCRWVHLERLVRTVFSISRIAEMKARNREPWHPTFMN